MSDIHDIHQAGTWAVLSPTGEVVDGTVQETGYSARASMTREHNLVWSKREEQGYVLARLVPQTCTPLLKPRESKGVTGANYTFQNPGHAVVATAVERDDVVGQTIEAVELALVSAGFDIGDIALRTALTTAYEAMSNKVD